MSTLITLTEDQRRIVELALCQAVRDSHEQLSGSQRCGSALCISIWSDSLNSQLKFLAEISPPLHQHMLHELAKVTV